MMKKKTFLAWLLILLIVPGAHGLGEPTSSSSDGMGTATVEPSGTFTAGSRGTWTIVYTVGEEGIANGGGIVLLVSPFWGWTPPQTWSPNRSGYVTAKVLKGDARIKLEDTRNNAVVVRVVRGSLKAGDNVGITYGDTKGGKNPAAAARIDKYSERDAAFYIKVDGDGDGYFKEIKYSPVIDIVARAPVKLFAVASSTVVSGKEGTLTLSALDPLNNWVRNYTGKIVLSSVPPGIELPETCLFQAKDGGTKKILFKVQSPGIFRIEAINDSKGLKASSNPIEVLASPPPYDLYWADPHGHSNFSDGTGLPEDYYRYARDVSGIDICALTDHDAWGIRPLDENPSMWGEIQRITNTFYRPGKFVTFIGYEWTNWTYGHMHVLFKGDQGTLYSNRSSKSNTPNKLWTVLPKGWALTIPHHPGGGPIGIDWSFYNPTFEPLVEICSVHGISERFLGPLAIYHPVEGGFVQKALERGYKLGFLGGGDSHSGHPGIPYVDALTFGLSGVYAKELTREGVWDAFLSRRTYATTGDRIILRFSINDSIMGEELDKAKQLEIDAEAVPCSPLKSFELVHNNKVIHRVKSNRMLYTYSGPMSTGDYFYVRVMQENDHQAFSSPIWVK